MSQTTATSAANAPTDAAVHLDLHSIRTCHDALILLKYQLNCDSIPAGPTDDAVACRQTQDRLAPQIQEAEAAAASCPKDLLTASAFYEATKELAVRGDIPAQRCFITGYFSTEVQEGDEARMSKEQVDEYRSLAKRFIDEAFERGDWSVVRWLARMRTGLGDGMLNSVYPFGSYHPETAYRMNYLLMLGKQQNYETRVDARQLIEQWTPDKDFGPKQMQDAEAWARDMYDQHFNGSLEGASLERFCEPWQGHADR